MVLKQSSEKKYFFTVWEENGLRKITEKFDPKPRPGGRVYFYGIVSRGVAGIGVKKQNLKQS